MDWKSRVGQMGDWFKRFLGSFDPTQGWSKHHKILTYVISIVLLGLLIFSMATPNTKVIERIIEVPAATQPVSPPTIIKETKEVIPLEIQDKLVQLEKDKAGLERDIDDLEEENADLKAQLVEGSKGQPPVAVITEADVVGTITGRQALDLIKASCPKTSNTGGLRAVEFSTADLIQESVFKNWLAQDKTEQESLGDSWNYISALEYKLRLQPGGKNIPINRARMGSQTLVAVVLYDSVDKAARLYVFSPLDEGNIRKISPSNPDQVIEYVHLD